MTNYITLTQNDRTRIFYFDHYTVASWTNPENMVDGDIGTYSHTWTDLLVQNCDENTFAADSSWGPVISKIEVRGLTSQSAGTLLACIMPVFSLGNGDEHSWSPTYYPNETWGPWLDITTDTNAPGTWAWTDVEDLEVDHYPRHVDGSPIIRTFKIQLQVSFHRVCTMIAPEDVSTDHAQNIKMMNMWDGERVVFGQSRSGWSLLLTGQDWENDACDKILCVKQLGLDGVPIVISGLNNLNWDTEWMIKSFGWKQVSRNPIHYEWMLLLERT